MKGIPTYPLRVQNDHVYVTVPIAEKMQENIDTAMVKRDSKNGTIIGIVGAGAAALTAAETLRQVGISKLLKILQVRTQLTISQPKKKCVTLSLCTIQ